MKQKTILITGATGFLGSYVTRELFDAGFYLKLLVGKTRKSAKERLYEVFPVTQIENYGFEHHNHMNKMPEVPEDITTAGYFKRWIKGRVNRQPFRRCLACARLFSLK